MVVFTPAQKAAIVAAVDRIQTVMQQRYGVNVQLRELEFTRDAEGAITGVRAAVLVTRPPDVDGQQAPALKYIEIWG